MKKKLKVCWISAGVSSFIAGYLSRDTIDKFIYILEPHRGRIEDEVMQECGILCYLALNE